MTTSGFNLIIVNVRTHIILLFFIILLYRILALFGYSRVKKLFWKIFKFKIFCGLSNRLTILCRGKILKSATARYGLTTINVK